MVIINNNLDAVSLLFTVRLKLDGITIPEAKPLQTFIK